MAGPSSPTSRFPAATTRCLEPSWPATRKSLKRRRGAWGERPPDLIIVQAGVGSLAGALAGWLIARFGAAGPHLVIAEPAGSACVLASLAADAPVTLPNCAPTAMVGLRCARVSPLAWAPIRDRADAAVSVAEEDNTEMRQRLARPRDGDPRILAGASGTCGLAALAAISHREDLATGAPRARRHAARRASSSS